MSGSERLPQARVSLNRIEEFLVKDDIEGRPEYEPSDSNGDVTSGRAPPVGVKVSHGTFTWPTEVSVHRSPTGLWNRGSPRVLQKPIGSKARASSLAVTRFVPDPLAPRSPIPAPSRLFTSFPHPHPLPA